MEADLLHEHCRLEEFRRWTRVVLEHEREHLSRALDGQQAFLALEERQAILHEITDVDFCLAQLGLRGE